MKKACNFIRSHIFSIHHHILQQIGITTYQINMKKTIVLLLSLLTLTSCVTHIQKSGKDLQSDTSIVAQTTIHIQNRPHPKQKLWMVGKNEIKENCNYLFSEESIYTISELPDSISLDFHGLFSAVSWAYNDHHPLVISPDMLWLVIEQGMGVHINHNAEQLRPQLVKFENKKDLQLRCEPGLLHKPAKNWEPYFSQFTSQLEHYTGKEFVNTMCCDFSTTNTVELTASQIALMSALQSYFNYELIETCGIPSVTLEGTPADWDHLVEKANALRKYELDWWIDELEPVLKKLAEASRGTVDKKFWNSIYKMAENDKEIYCGVDDNEITGWIIKFYPYDRQGNRNNMKAFNLGDIESLPSEISYAPLHYIELTGKEYNLKLYAGIFGFTEDLETRALRPVIGWAVTSADN